MVFESSQTMNDIPFGDHFTVESRWDFSAAPPRADGTAQTKVQCEQAPTMPSCASFGLVLQMPAVTGRLQGWNGAQEKGCSCLPTKGQKCTYSGDVRVSEVYSREEDCTCTQAVNHVHIPFAKHTMWKKAIIKGTLDSCRDVHEDMVRSSSQYTVQGA